MRSALVLLPGVLALSGCLSDFRPEFVLPSDCDRRLFFEDRDGDGWGDPLGAVEALCEANPAAGLTARNGLDCDDADPSNTGRVATLCPDNLIVGGSEYLAFAASGREVAVVIPSSGFAHADDPSVDITPVVPAQAAAEACGRLGWGGGLATFANLAELTAVTDALNREMQNATGPTYFAAWVGLGPASDGRSWVWQGRDGGLGLAEVGFCDPDDVPSPAEATHADRRLALVRRPITGRWCFGRPDQANPESAGEGQLVYPRLDAHFVCDRPTPQASAFADNRRAPN